MRCITFHPQAKFDPIPPDLNLKRLVENTATFEWVLRVSVSQIRNLGQQEFEKLVLLHVIQGGRPLVIEKWDEVLPRGLFDVNWLEQTYDKKQENVRDITNQVDIPMTMGHYLRSMRKLASQWTPLNFRDERRQRLYLKDIDCPPEWEEALRKIIPPNLFYMNENVADRGIKTSDDNVFRNPDSSAAPAGDLMSSLPKEMRAQNLMCYIGHEGTYTPAHREMCASLGQNIMVEASQDNDKGETKGSSIWFMTESKDREVVREYFLSMLGHDIEIEKHFAQINAWKKATFPVYVVEQKPGDFILVPPLAPHQVWNRGTRTMKVAWNRTTVETLEFALHEALPKARLVCRDEQYKNKAIIYYTLKKYYDEMTNADLRSGLDGLVIDKDTALEAKSLRRRTMEVDFRRLFFLFADILGDEVFGFEEKNVEYIEFDSNITCSFCRANIFNRFLTCKHCVRTLIGGDEDAYDICMECYAMGRSCFCISNLQWCEQWKWSELVENYETWRKWVIEHDGFIDIDESPVPVDIVLKRRKKKTLVHVCQEGLIHRPFKDIKAVQQAPLQSDSEGEVSVDDEGRIKQRKNKKARKTNYAIAKKEKGSKRCHVCGHPDYPYKMQSCSTPGCKEVYCYGTLYRGFDQMPQDVQQAEDWRCPKCLGICNCGYCRRAGAVNYYLPKRTLLGHDTRLIADDRSVESLVDFRMHNLSWLKYTGEDARSNNSRRMQQLRAQAEKAKTTAQGAQEAANLLSQQSAGGSVNPDDSVIPDVSVLADADITVADGEEIEGPGMVIPDEQRSRLHELPGMGYYQQGNSEDRILFDHYEIPTKEKFKLEDPEMSEYVLKSIKAAKRRAKNKEEDPEFRIGGFKKAKSKMAKKDEMVLEDAEGEGTTEKNTEGDQPADSKNADVSVISTIAGDVSIPLIDQPASTDEWQPSLRHAKPRKSYAEGEDDQESEIDPDDIIPYNHVGILHSRRPKVPKATPKPAIDEDDMDIDLPIVTVDDKLTEEAARQRELEAKVTTVNKEGNTNMEHHNGPLPPRRARKEPVRDVSTNSEAEEIGRKRRRSGNDRAYKGPSGSGGTPKGLGKRKGPGRLPKARDLSTSVSASESYSANSSASEAEDYEVKDKEKEETPPPRMMSMAERMKMRGKPFKIGQRMTPLRGCGGVRGVVRGCGRGGAKVISMSAVEKKKKEDDDKDVEEFEEVDKMPGEMKSSGFKAINKQIRKVVIPVKPKKWTMAEDPFREIEDGRVSGSRSESERQNKSVSASASASASESMSESDEGDDEIPSRVTRGTQRGAVLKRGAIRGGRVRGRA